MCNNRICHWFHYYRIEELLGKSTNIEVTDDNDNSTTNVVKCVEPDSNNNSDSENVQPSIVNASNTSGTDTKSLATDGDVKNKEIEVNQSGKRSLCDEEIDEEANENVISSPLSKKICA